MLTVGCVVMTVVMFNETIYSFVFRLFDGFPKVKNALMFSLGAHTFRAETVAVIVIYVMVSLCKS